MLPDVVQHVRSRPVSYWKVDPQLRLLSIPDLGNPSPPLNLVGSEAEKLSPLRNLQHLMRLLGGLEYRLKTAKDMLMQLVLTKDNIRYKGSGRIRIPWRERRESGK